MKLLSNLKKSILLDTILYTAILIGIKLILNHFFALEYREWIYVVSGVLIGLGFVIGVIQLFLKIPQKWIKNLCIVLFLVALVGVSPYILLIAAFGIVPEHEVELAGEKVVGRVYGFLDTHVEYYQDVNFLVRGLKTKRVEYYGNGSFDPLEESEYHHEPIEIVDPIQERVEEKKKVETKQSKEEINQIAKDQEKDYEKWFNDLTGIRVIIMDYAMGKEAVQIFKTTDGGESWNLTLETENQALWVHYYSEFYFWNEQVGFIFDPGRAGDSSSKATLLVSIDGGRSFQEAKIDSRENQEVNLKGLPYEKDGRMFLEGYIYQAQEKVQITYQTNDQGITWKK